MFETVKVCESLKECESVEETEEVSGFNPLGSGLFESSRLTTASNRFLQKVARPDKNAAVLHKLWFVLTEELVGPMPSNGNVVHNENSAHHAYKSMLNLDL